jgi:hypothetical protein
VTRYSATVRAQLAKHVVGQTIEAMDYDEEDDYYTILLSGGTEFSFRFMSDLTPNEAKASP